MTLAPTKREAAFRDLGLAEKVRYRCSSHIQCRLVAVFRLFHFGNENVWRPWTAYGYAATVQTTSFQSTRSTSAPKILVARSLGTTTTQPRGHGGAAQVRQAARPTCSWSLLPGKGKYKRHVLQEVDPNLFMLLPVGHQLYTKERWSQETALHGNEGSRVYLQRFQAPATTAAEAAEATEQPNYRDRDQPREEEPWIRVDAAAPPPEEAEHDATLPPPEEAENDAEPQPPEKAELDAEPTTPCWARKGAAAPKSFDDLINSTPQALLCCNTTATYPCAHNNLNKTGTNAFQARIKCTDCGVLLALYIKPRK